MPGTLGSAPLLTPWFGMWDLMNGQSEYSIVLVAGLFTVALVGVVLTMYGSHFREQPAERKAMAVHVPRPIQRQRHRRR